ncbi:MAG: SGNH/GDSL hydrolase family protein [Clostridia bacterium]|nr:SGNH/GDSL hydrolase family protein [Clostridia bacterium]
MKSVALRLFALLLSLLLCLPLFACGSDPVPPETPDEPPEETPEDTPNTSVDPNAPHEIKVNWHFGYVASATHANSPNTLVENGDRYSYTDVFTVPKAGTTITFTDDNSNSGSDYRYASASAYVVSSWKQENGEWVLDLNGANVAGSNGTLESLVEAEKQGDAVLYAYTTYSDNEQLRLCFRSGQKTNHTPAAYPVITATYTGAPCTAAEQIELGRWFEASKAAHYDTRLEGLTVNALGDSYFAGSGLPAEQIWLNLLARKYGMEMNNYGIGGSTVTYGGGNPMCVRYTGMKNNDPDIVILEGGRNDYNWQFPIGDLDSSDIETYCGAWNVLIDGIQQKYPDAMIVMISPWNFPDEGKAVTREQYAAAMSAVAAAQGIYFIDASITADTGVDMGSSQFRRKYCKNPNDVSHLNAEGMKLVMPNFEKLILACYVDFLEKSES